MCVRFCVPVSVLSVFVRVHMYVQALACTRASLNHCCPYRVCGSAPASSAKYLQSTPTLLQAQAPPPIALKPSHSPPCKAPPPRRACLRLRIHAITLTPLWLACLVSTVNTIALALASAPVSPLSPVVLLLPLLQLALGQRGHFGCCVARGGGSRGNGAWGLVGMKQRLLLLAFDDGVQRVGVSSSSSQARLPEVDRKWNGACVESVCVSVCVAAAYPPR